MALEHVSRTRDRFADMLADTITITKESAKDKYGKQTFGGTVLTYTCRVQEESKLIRDPAGKEVVQTGAAYIPGVTNISTSDKLTLPDGSVPVILAVDVARDDTEDHHTVVRFGLS